MLDRHAGTSKLLLRAGRSVAMAAAGGPGSTWAIASTFKRGTDVLTEEKAAKSVISRWQEKNRRKDGSKGVNYRRRLLSLHLLSCCEAYRRPVSWRFTTEAGVE